MLNYHHERFRKLTFRGLTLSSERIEKLQVKPLKPTIFEVSDDLTRIQAHLLLFAVFIWGAQLEMRVLVTSFEKNIESLYLDRVAHNSH